MTDLEPLLRFWRAQDDLFAHVEVTWWGAVVSDARFPSLQEPNYARVETRQPVLLSEIEDVLIPAIRASGCTRSHVVIFHPQEQTDLVVEASTRGDRVVWDLVMATSGLDRGPGKVQVPSHERVEEIADLDRAFWSVHRDSARAFDVSEEDTLDQLEALEREVLIPAGRRWFSVADGGRAVTLGALLVLERIGFVDHVVTFPEARRRGHAGELTRRLVAEASATGASRTYLLAEPEGDAVRIYDRIGFDRVGYLASWLSPLER